MEFTVVEILLGIIAFFSGNMVNQWWDRGRPLFVLEGFCSIIDPIDWVEYPDELQDLTDESWYFNKLIEKPCSLANLYDIYGIAEEQRYQLDEAIEKSDQWIEELTRIVNSPDFDMSQSKRTILSKIKDVVFEILHNDAMRTAIDYVIGNKDLDLKNLMSVEEVREIENLIDQEESYKKQKLTDKMDLQETFLDKSVYKSTDTEEESQLTIIDISEKQLKDVKGLYLVVWPRDWTMIGYFGDNDVYLFLKDRFKYLIPVLKTLNGKILLKLIKAIQPIVERQSRTCEHIQEIIKPLIDQNRQWVAKIRMENYGRSPIIISSDAKLIVDESKLPVECNLLLSETEPDELHGKYILGRNKKEVFWVKTKMGQFDQLSQQYRNSLLGYYNNDKIFSSAYIELNVEIKGNLKRKTKIRCEQLPFKGSLAYPYYSVE